MQVPDTEFRRLWYRYTHRCLMDGHGKLIQALHERLTPEATATLGWRGHTTELAYNKDIIRDVRIAADEAAKNQEKYDLIIVTEAISDQVVTSHIGAIPYDGEGYGWKRHLGEIDGIPVLRRETPEAATELAVLHHSDGKRVILISEF